MKRGYAVSGMLYTILVLFMALLLSFLYTMQNKKNILDKLKTEVVEAFYCSKADNIEDLRGATVIATSVKQEGDNALIQLPKEGRYDTTSYLSVPMSEISSDLNNENNTACFGITTTGSGSSANFSFGLGFNGTFYVATGQVQYDYQTILNGNSKSWYGISVTYDLSNLEFVVTALEDVYYSTSPSMTNKVFLSQGSTISWAYNVQTSYYFIYK